jgi:hypothetical protein
MAAAVDPPSVLDRRDRFPDLRRNRTALRPAAGSRFGSGSAAGSCFGSGLAAGSRFGSGLAAGSRFVSEPLDDASSGTDGFVGSKRFRPSIG